MIRTKCWNPFPSQMSIRLIGQNFIVRVQRVRTDTYIRLYCMYHITTYVRRLHVYFAHASYAQFTIKTHLPTALAATVVVAYVVFEHLLMPQGQSRTVQHTQPLKHKITRRSCCATTQVRVVRIVEIQPVCVVGQLQLALFSGFFMCPFFYAFQYVV